MQEDIVLERSEKAALERILQKEKDLMDSAVQREMGRAASLQVELLAAQQQRVRLFPLIIVCYSVSTLLTLSPVGVHSLPGLARLGANTNACECELM